MDLIIYSLKAVAVAIVEPLHLLMLIIFGILFYLKNKKISAIQRMTIGERINSPLELTLSQIVLGILAGAIGTIILTILGVTFKENSGIEFLFIISILMLFYKKKFISFAYTGAILGAIGIVMNIVQVIVGKKLYFDVDILALTTFIAVIYIIEALLIMIDGGRGAIPVFTKKDNKIIGGFSFNRYWALPIAILMIFNNELISLSSTIAIETPNWWPIIKTNGILDLLTTAMMACIPLYGVMGYNSVTFTKEKNKKPLLSGLLIFILGISILVIAQLSRLNIIGQIIAVAFMPLAYEFIIRYDRKLENDNNHHLYVSDDEGIMILEVAPNLPGYEAGIRSGDKILSINGTSVTSEADILKAAKDGMFKMQLSVKKKSGQVLEYFVQPRNKRIGILLVPKMVKVEDIVGADTEDFKRILEELKSKK